ncbi:MAG: Asp-tRNA(Asn)/Glu-tRNA(Gln) amidotransferase subunit GatC [Ardenticatenaceae bacterium]|nr:Asp-tRNA(Asn)/Glu-tRNA(Gln) amidotransferase subunit GatC [Ardenticatenaceae bacterium]
MSLTIQDVEHIAGLARLGLTKEEKERFRQQLSAILEYAERLQALDTAAIPPTAQVIEQRNVMRADLVEPSLPQEEALANAPQDARGFFVVPTVLEEHSA